MNRFGECEHVNHRRTPVALAPTVYPPTKDADEWVEGVNRFANAQVRAIREKHRNAEQLQAKT